jgi:MFS-type transporter involved in bile tolerance (Atg22 family)
MTQDGRTPDKGRAEGALKMALVGVIGQVGCLTLLIILVALIAGLWLDNQFQTRPLFALIFVLASVPLTIYLMFRVVLSFAPRIQAFSAGAVETDTMEEFEGGEDSADPK